jgi:FMN phosphatase YigB (HAD superfamily)
VTAVRTAAASSLDLAPAEAGAALPVLVLDFDGTVCLGDGPIWAYAEALLPQLDDEHARRVTAGLAAFLAGDTEPGDFSDGYSAVVRLAGPGVPSSTLNAAYLASREALAHGRVDVHSPDGLPELLAELTGTARRVLLTNAPDIGMPMLLDRLGLVEVIDEVITSAGKPDGFVTLLPRLLDGADPARLLSVGDVWLNDIARPLAAGCATAYVDRTGADPRPAHARATTLPGLYSAIRAWAVDPHVFVTHHHPGAVDPDALEPSPRS